MIQRILVPKDARPLAAPSEAPARRVTSDLDSRTLVPSNLPHIELDGRTLIPSHIPLGVLGTRTVVPRDMPFTPLDGISKTPDYVPLTILDSRIAVPKDAHSSKIEPKQLVAIQDLPDVLDPDVLTTGEVNLMAQHLEEKTSAWNTVARFASVALHFVVILLILFGPKVFPPGPSTTSEIARNNITDLYLPNDVKNLAKIPAAPQPKSPQIHVDPRVLRQLAPPREVQPTPNPPEPERVVRDNPTPAPPVPQPRTQPLQDSPIKPPPTPPDPATSSLVLPRFSPGRALQENLHEALKDGGTASVPFGVPSGRLGGGGMGGEGGGGQGQLGGSLEMLTPTEGVDFTNYLARLRASIQRNWEAVMPESARLGERGKVVLQFQIMKNGVVPEPQPAMVGTSGKDPLDRAAVSSIRASNPFEPLPPAFSGPYIELRCTFLYNLPLNAQ
jgi:outer membrane biosynthesis protein TonB